MIARKRSKKEAQQETIKHYKMLRDSERCLYVVADVLQLTPSIHVMIGIEGGHFGSAPAFKLKEPSQEFQDSAFYQIPTGDQAAIVSHFLIMNAYYAPLFGTQSAIFMMYGDIKVAANTKGLPATYKDALLAFGRETEWHNKRGLNVDWFVPLD